MLQKKIGGIATKIEAGFKAKEKWIFFLIIYSIALFALIPRLDGYEYFPGKYLWAEDGKVFLNDSQALGVSAIFKPYAGYLHFYPRVIASFSSGFDLIYRPLVILGGWLLAYFILTHVVARTAKAMGLGLLTTTALICLVSLQPNYGEIFFNITNSQWMIGAALALYAFANSVGNVKQKITRGVLLVPLGLTGPFSIILVPVLLLKVWLKKDWKNNKYNYLPIFACAAIQVLVLIKSDRISSGLTSQAPLDWLSAFLQIFLFGANNIYTLCAVVLFWLLTAYSLLGHLTRSQSKCDNFLFPLFLLISAGLVIFSGLFAFKHDPLAMVSPGGGSRYSWIPYVLIYVAALVASNGRRLVVLTIIVLSGFICFQGFHGVSSPDLQFKSFAKFSKFQDVIIPIHPQWPTYPGWHIIGAPNRNSGEPQSEYIEISQKTVTVAGLSADFVGGGMKLRSTSNDPMVIFKTPMRCAYATDLALEINMTREKEGWMQLFWSDNGEYSESRSIRRWYPSGSVKAQFAFPISNSAAYIRFDPHENIGFAAIQKIKFYCL